jgi:anthranilate/para-aminobenzoate synthase component II
VLLLLVPPLGTTRDWPLRVDSEGSHDSCYNSHDNGEELELIPGDVTAVRVHSLVAVNHGLPISVEALPSKGMDGAVRVRSLAILSLQF